MNTVEIAFLAIKGLGPITNMNGGKVLEIMRSLQLTTEEAARLRRMVGGAVVAGNDEISGAKELTNRYARDYSVR